MKKSRNTTFAVAITGCILLAVTLITVRTAQAADQASIEVIVTEPQGRTVAGLERRHFTLNEGGVQRTITAFAEQRDESAKGRTHYVLQFESSRAGAPVGVVLNPPRGLPPLTVTWK